MKRALLERWATLQVPGTSRRGPGKPSVFHGTYNIGEVIPSRVWLAGSLQDPWVCSSHFCLVLVLRRDEAHICTSGSRMALGLGFKSRHNPAIWECSMFPAGFSGFADLLNSLRPHMKEKKP